METGKPDYGICHSYACGEDPCAAQVWYCVTLEGRAALSSLQPSEGAEGKSEVCSLTNKLCTCSWVTVC